MIIKTDSFVRRLLCLAFALRHESLDNGGSFHQQEPLGIQVGFFFIIIKIIMFKFHYPEQITAMPIIGEAVWFAMSWKLGKAKHYCTMHLVYLTSFKLPVTNLRKLKHASLIHFNQEVLDVNYDISPVIACFAMAYCTRRTTALLSFKLNYLNRKITD